MEYWKGVVGHRWKLVAAGHVWERAVRVVNYSAFLKERQQSLTAFLHAALTVDPKVEDWDGLGLEQFS